ncbi:MAG: hypothetical protein IPP90_05315 [Gemmatimonadaceae bacterium]|nr:hypothetical protein [Gemmatimonadaceae bacterium]
MSEPLAQLAPLTLLIALLVLSWDILLAGWMASRREAPSAFTRLTSLCGLLVAPALVVAIASGTEDGARTVSGISWLLPAVCAAFVLQVLYAIVVGLVSPVVALPILFYDLVVTAVVTGDYLVATRGAAPLPLQAAVAARDVVFGMTVGRASLVSPFAILVPMIAPAYPARWRLSALTRAIMVLAATAVTTVLIIEWPRGVAAVRSYQRVAATPMQARPLGDFAIGMRFLPVLDGPPPARAAKADRALLQQFEPDAILLVLNEEGTRAGALDSLARLLEPLRSDSTVIAVALHQGRHVARADDAARASAMERVLIRLRPDVLFPAVSDPIPSVLPADAPSISWWRLLLTSSDAVRARVRPATRLGVALSRLDARDSAIYAWAVRSSSPVGVIGAVVFPSFSGLPGVDARLRAFDRWHTRADSGASRAPTHWLMNVGGLPRAHGDLSQLVAMRHTLAWGSRRPWVTSVILGEPADYDGAMGVRAADGRVRLAWRVLSTEAKAMRDVRAR